MNYYLYLIFLFSLSFLSLFTFGLYRILDIVRVNTKQKLTFLKIGMLMIAIAPLIFSMLRYFSWSALVITLPGTLGANLSDHAVHTSFTEAQVDWSFYIFLAYNLGFFVMLTRVLFSYIAAKKQLADSVPATIHDVSLLLSNNIHTPLSFGLPTAKIYFPVNEEYRWTTREIQMSLAHEKTHVKHYDSIWKLISLIAQAILFFVPWTYWLHRQLELEMEVYCDEKTCAETGAHSHEYGSLLLAMTCTQPQNLIFTNITDSTLKRRLIAMKSISTKRPFLISAFIAAIIMAGTAAVAMTSGIAEKKTVFDIYSKIYVDGKLVSSPHIKALADQKARIEMGETMTRKGNQLIMSGQNMIIEIIARNTAKSGTKDSIDMNYDVRYQDGDEKIHFKPRMIVVPKQEGRVNFSSKSGHVYELRVIAERV